jgi:spore germination protein KA
MSQIIVKRGCYAKVNDKGEYMFRNSAKKKQEIVDTRISDINEQLAGLKLSRSLDDNVALLEGLFTDVDTLRTRRFACNRNTSLKYCIVYSEGVVDITVINDNIIKPLMLSDAAEPGRRLIDTLASGVLQVNDAKPTGSLVDIVEGICYGDTALLAEGAAQALMLNTKKFKQRNVAEPDSEKTLTGPREGFTETLETNLSLLRRKVKTHELKMKLKTMGRRTRTSVCVCYFDGIVNKKVLAELYRRLDKVDIDAVLDTNYLTEFIRDSRFSLFRTIGYTERPDVVIGKLLEGRIAILVDGSPAVLTLPYLFIENFQSSEDYYLSFFYTSFSRLLRMIGLLFTITVPAFFIAIVAFHREMMPTQLLINIAAERQNAPLPAVAEAFVMIIIFDILRETGVRMPSNIGQALSIVGALVIGQSAVEARLVAAPMIIVVAFTGITALLVPKLNAPIIYLRLGLLFIAAMFGFYGLVAGLSLIAVHIISLRSFGVPQISLTGNLQYQEVKDTFFRAPWWQMRIRSRIPSWNKTRLKNNTNSQGAKND